MYVINILSSVHVSAVETEMSGGKPFEGDILLMEGDKPYEYRKKRSEVGSLTSNIQLLHVLSMMGSGDNAENSHIWPNNTVYYTFGVTLGELATYSIIVSAQ